MKCCATMCQQKAFGVPRALISQFFAAVMEAIFPSFDVMMSTT